MTIKLKNVIAVHAADAEVKATYKAYMAARGTAATVNMSAMADMVANVATGLTVNKVHAAAKVSAKDSGVSAPSDAVLWALATVGGYAVKSGLDLTSDHDKESLGRWLQVRYDIVTLVNGKAYTTKRADVTAAMNNMSGLAKLESWIKAAKNNDKADKGDDDDKGSKTKTRDRVVADATAAILRAVDMDGEVPSETIDALMAAARKLHKATR